MNHAVYFGVLILISPLLPRSRISGFGCIGELQVTIEHLLTTKALTSALDRTVNLIALHPEYGKRKAYECEGRTIKFKGGRALSLDLLIAKKPAGIHRSQTWRWCANLGDTISALRARGLLIDCQAGTYTLKSEVRRMGDELR